MPPEPDPCAIRSLIARFERQRLPRVLAIKAKVFRSSVLEPSDHAVLDALLADALQARRYCAHDTDAAALYRRAAALYLEIMRRALHNEQRPSGLTGLAANASGL